MQIQLPRQAAFGPFRPAVSSPAEKRPLFEGKNRALRAVTGSDFDSYLRTAVAQGQDVQVKALVRALPGPEYEKARRAHAAIVDKETTRLLQAYRAVLDQDPDTRGVSLEKTENARGLAADVVDQRIPDWTLDLLKRYFDSTPHIAASKARLRQDLETEGLIPGDGTKNPYPMVTVRQTLRAVRDLALLEHQVE